jgi:MerR family transcriptional regulator, copper efflux regulator
MSEQFARNHPTMMIGELARRTGVVVKVSRRQQDMCLIDTRGRTATGYRLIDENALRCVQIVRGLRNLGLTESEIQHLAKARDDNSRLIGPPLAALLHRSRTRIEERIAGLERQRRRIDDFGDRYREALIGHHESCTPDPWGHDAGEVTAPLDSPTAGTPEAC